MKNHFLFSIILIMLAGCSANSSLTSSFSKRKYTPGNFFNTPAAKPIVTANPMPVPKSGNSIVAKQNQVIDIVPNNPEHTLASEQVMTHKSIKGLTNILKQSVASAPKYQLQKARANTLPIPPDTTLRKTGNGQVYGPNDEMRTSKILTVMSSIFLLAAIIIPSITSLVFLPTWFFIIISLAFIIMALITSMQWAEKSKKPNVSDNTSNGDANSSPVGLIGFIAEMVGLVLLFLSTAGIGIGGSIFLWGFVSSAVSVAFPLLAAFFLIVGLALCLASLSRKNKYYGVALAGTITAILILGIIIANYVMNNMH